MMLCNPVSLCVIVVAGGSGRRFGDSTPKQFLDLAGVPVLIHTLKRLDAARAVARVILVLPRDKRDWFEREILPAYPLEKLSDTVPGGDIRQASVANGLALVDADHFPCVAVHDGVRPFFDPRWLEAGLEVLEKFPAVAVGIPPVDTVKRVSGRGFVAATPRRDSLMMIQTPQMFHTRLLQEAHERARREGWAVSDDAALMERMGIPVKVLPGNRWNIKITEPADLKIGEVILRLEKEGGNGS